MSSQHRRLLAGFAAAAGVAALAAAPAAASPPPAVHCGQTLTTSVKLKADLVDCPGDGLIIGASGITVDLNGHTIDGVSTGTDCDARPEHPATGIANHGVYDRITVANGAIRQFDIGFDAGSDTDGMSDSRIHDLVLRDNSFGGITFGSAVLSSDVRNVVDHNVVSGSPCGSGIEVNTGQQNRFSGNRVDDSGTGILICCGNDSDGNVAAGNRVRRTLGSGIFVFQSGATRVVGNATSDTGDAGITLIGPGSRDSVISGNVITRAQFSGINVDGCPDCGDGPALDGLRVDGNRISATGDGILLSQTDDDAVRWNTVSAAGSFGTPEIFGTGVLLDGVSRARLVGNTISGGAGVLHAAIMVGGLPPGFEPSSRAMDGNVVAGNVVTGQKDGDGVLVGANATNTVIRLNTANRNGRDGIHVLSASTLLKRNGAFSNVVFGIEAVAGVTDGGGNVAHRNGNSAQCSGVSCG
jgi:Right handed beta helix region